MAAPAAWFGLGRLPDGRRIAVWTDGVGYRMGTVVGDNEPSPARDDRDLLLAAAVGWFTEALPTDTSDRAASQQDLAGLVGWLSATAPDATERAGLNRAIDAIDDGQPGEVVAAELVAARPSLAAADAVEMLLRPPAASEPSMPASRSTPGRNSRRRR